MRFRFDSLGESRRLRQKGGSVLLLRRPPMRRALGPWHGANPRVMLETGVRLKHKPGPRNFDHEGPLRLLWSGVFEHRKALHLLLQALAALPSHVKYELHILGRGPLGSLEANGPATRCRTALPLAGMAGARETRQRTFGPTCLYSQACAIRPALSCWKPLGLERRRYAWTIRVWRTLSLRSAASRFRLPRPAR